MLRAPMSLEKMRYVGWYSKLERRLSADSVEKLPDVTSQTK
jgi:hypothetical protein